VNDTDPSTPQLVHLTGHARIESPPREDGYRPICDPLWVWAALAGAPSRTESRVGHTPARRLDAGHLQIERVRDGINRLQSGTPPLGSPAGRAVMHEVIGDAELAIIALDAAITIAVSLTGRYRVTAGLPALVGRKQTLVRNLRDHYSHVKERALGYVPEDRDVRFEDAFNFDALINDREYTEGADSLGIDAEATELIVATRDYLVRVWTELVARAARGSA
jgi:hypothetical protein